ncbi:MAG: penicillin-binding protein 2 [Ruminococcaceae bacterium]|nr:penicillin-binding protein 2 [Oscillospiraceae bacterium]
MKRIIFVLIIVLFMFSLLPIRLYSLMVKQTEFAAVSNSTKEIILSELRGEIYDCNMKKLVNNTQENIIIVHPEKENSDLLYNLIDENEYSRLLECFDSGKPFVCNSVIDNEKFPTAEIFRRYTDSGFCCHVVGYINAEDNKGVSGIEKSFDTLLKEDNRRLLYVYNTTAQNKILAGGRNEIVSQNYYSVKGVQLTIDYNIQKIAENAMWLYGVDKGAVVVMDSSNGEIRAMASTPKFNQNDIQSSLDNKDSPFINRAVNSYCVGSVFKLVVAATAVKEGKTNFVSYCNGSVSISEKTFACSSHTAHGNVDIRKAMAHSCNTYFIRLALELGAEKILATAENMGFGKSFTLADGFFNSSGTLPQIEDVMNNGEIANLSFGQGGLLSTPLQVACCYSSAVNGGNFIEPKLIKNFVNADGGFYNNKSSQYVYRAFAKGESDILKDILINDFTEGTCVSSKPENCIAGGKTSTAQTGWIDEKGEEILHGWFAGFVQTSGTVYTIVVFKENAVSGSEDCGPVFKEIAERIANNY